MADNTLSVVISDGVTAVGLASRDAGVGGTAGRQAQRVDVAPWTHVATGETVAFTAGAAASGRSGGGSFTIPAGTTHVVIGVKGGNVRMTEFGTNPPTATTGIPLADGFLGEWALAFQLNFIAESGAPVVTLAPRKYVT